MLTALFDIAGSLMCPHPLDLLPTANVTRLLLDIIGEEALLGILSLLRVWVGGLQGLVLIALHLLLLAPVMSVEYLLLVLVRRLLIVLIHLLVLDVCGHVVLQQVVLVFQ